MEKDGRVDGQNQALLHVPGDRSELEADGEDDEPAESNKTDKDRYNSAAILRPVHSKPSMPRINANINRHIV